MNLLIVRHAESMGNAGGDYSSATSDSLSPKGEEQALSLVTSLKSRHFNKIIVSPLQRTIQTATPYLVAANQKAEIWPEIAEACWQEQREEPSERWSKQSSSLPEDVAHLFAYRDDEAVRPAHPESFGEGLCRTRDAMDRLQRMAELEDTSALMVTHGHFIRELINLALDTRNTVRFPHDNCGMTLLSFDRTWVMEFCNRQIDPAGSFKPDSD